MNAVECEPVETRVLNLNASDASYKPKQRSYRKTNLKISSSDRVPAPKCPAPKCPRHFPDAAQSVAPKRTRPENNRLKKKVSKIFRQSKKDIIRTYF